MIFPERDMGLRVAHHLVSPNILDYIDLSDDYSIMEMQATGNCSGTISESWIFGPGSAATLWRSEANRI